jgi:transposase
MAFAAATHSRDLTDEQWALIGGFLPEPVRRADGPGRPWRENRAVLNGILWMLRTGARGLTWFQNFRRIVVRYERLAENFLGMLHLASCLILLRGL